MSFEDFQNYPKTIQRKSPEQRPVLHFLVAKKTCVFFTPQSQIQSFNYFNALKPDYHSLHLLPEYGHLDVFMGKNAAVDTFPLMIAELNKS